MGSDSRIREITKQIAAKYEMTHEQISIRSGVSRSTISNFMSARRGLTLKSADAILGAFGLEIRICKKRGQGNETGQEADAGMRIPETARNN